MDQLLGHSVFICFHYLFIDCDPLDGTPLPNSQVPSHFHWFTVEPSLSDLVINVVVCL